jgi:transcriptional regulator with XRE-family HTH domain
MKLSEKIYALRKGLKMNQTAFGELCGVEQSTVARWEKTTDPATPRFDQMMRISETANMSLEQFVKGTDYTREATASGIDLVGFVGAGAVVNFFQQNVQDMAHVRSFPDAPAGVEALELRDGVLGADLNGWIAYFHKVGAGVPASCLGELCVVWINPDHVAFGRIEAGSKGGLYTIRASFAPPIYDTPAINAAKIIHIQPRIA